MADTLERPTPAIATGLLAAAAALGLAAGVEPPLAIGASLGLAFAVVAFTHLAAGVAAFTALVFLEFVLPGGPVLSLTKAAGLVLALSWIVRIATSRERPTFPTAHPAAAIVLLAFLCWGALSTVWSEDPGETLLGLSRYAQVMALLLIVYTAVDRRMHAWWVFAALIVGTAVTAAYGLITNPVVDPHELLRVASTVGNADVVASVVVSGLALSIGAALALRRAPLLRAGALAVVAICLVTLIFTGSRSGVISLGVVLVTGALVAGRRRGPALLGSLALALTAVLLFAALAPPTIKDRISQTSPGQVRSDEGRLTLWQVGWRMVEDEPIRGVGLGSFPSSSIHYILQPGTLSRTDQVIATPKVTHNVYLQAWAETGTVGLALLIGVLAFPVGCAVAAARRFERLGDREMEIMSRALVAATAGVLASNLFASEQYNKLLWLLLALGPALLAVANLRTARGVARAQAAGRTALRLRSYSPS